MKKYLLYILSVFLLLSCQDSIETPQVVDVNDAPDLAGQVIRFTAGYSSMEAKTRAPFTNAENMQTEVGKYVPAGSDQDPGYSHGYNYIYNVEMFKPGEADPVSLGSAQYQLASNGTTKRTDGLLDLVFPSGDATNTALFWPDNVNGYGFHVTAGNDEISPNQNGLNEFFDNDRLEGYGFSPVFTATEDLDNLNYHSSKTWYTNNKTWLGEGKSQELYKAVPLFLQHQHAWVSIILKAGKGIQRDFLWYENTSHGFNSDMYYYEGSTKKTITNPWRRSWHVDYVADSNGAAETGDEQNTTMLHAIIEPTNFLEHPENLIGQIKLNGLTFTYAPINDNNYGRWNTYKDASEETINALGETEAAAIRKALSDMQAYNVTAGKHLKITVTLTTDKIVLITALLEDWDEMFFSSICDDYGNNGDPIIIANRAELWAFLSDPNKNKAGNTAVISSLSIDLDDADNTWEAQPLNCTLNLAGCVLHTSGQFLTNIAQSGSLINGEINVNGVKRSDEMNAAVCNNNYGTIEQVSITVDESVRHDVYAKQAGIAAVNWGTVFNCESNLNVLGTTGYIGGIVGESKRNGDDGPLPVVDRCTMNGRVGATGDAFTGVGGIAGYAEYRLSRCAFTYGMTLSQQNNVKYKNIVVATTTDESLKVDAFGNSWPTTVVNTIGKNATTNANINTLAQYNAVIDSQAELYELLANTSHYADGTSRYRIADDFNVDDSWSLGIGEEDGIYAADASTYNLNFELDGNGKTITTNGKMLFSHINGYFHDFTVYCNEPMIAVSNNDATDVMAPLAYSVNKKNGTSGQATLENIKVVMREGTTVGETLVPGAYVQAAMPSGMIVWAYGGAKVINCEVTADVRVKYSSEFNNIDAKKFAGGIAAASVDATFNGCVVHSNTTISSDHEDNAAAIKNHYRGGIVGGVYTKPGFTPATVIIDCNSWWGDRNSGENYSPAGSLVGATKYDLNNTPTNGIGSGSTGNWWPETYTSAADIDNSTAAKLLGKRNTITPTEYSGEQY